MAAPYFTAASDLMASTLNKRALAPRTRAQALCRRGGIGHAGQRGGSGGGRRGCRREWRVPQAGVEHATAGALPGGDPARDGRAAKSRSSESEPGPVPGATHSPLVTVVLMAGRSCTSGAEGGGEFRLEDFRCLHALHARSPLPRQLLLPEGMPACVRALQIPCNNLGWWLGEHRKAPDEPPCQQREVPGLPRAEASQPLGRNIPPRSQHEIRGQGPARRGQGPRGVRCDPALPCRCRGLRG